MAAGTRALIKFCLFAGAAATLAWIGREAWSYFSAGTGSGAALQSSYDGSDPRQQHHSSNALTGLTEDSTQTESGSRHLIAPQPPSHIYSPPQEIETSENQLGRDREVSQSRIQNDAPETAETKVELSASAVGRWRQTVWADCHGEVGVECDRLISTFTSVLNAPDFVDDGWAEWMESQIRQSILAKASEYKATRADVKCASEGCVFVLYSETASQMFDHGWRHSNDFDSWLRTQPWNEWLEVHSKLNGNSFTLAWRVVGSLNATPFINWYVVTRKR